MTRFWDSYLAFFLLVTSSPAIRLSSRLRSAITCEVRLGSSQGAKKAAVVAIYYILWTNRTDGELIALENVEPSYLICISRLHERKACTPWLYKDCCVATGFYVRQFTRTQQDARVNVGCVYNGIS